MIFKKFGNFDTNIQKVRGKKSTAFWLAHLHLRQQIIKSEIYNIYPKHQLNETKTDNQLKHLEFKILAEITKYFLYPVLLNLA